MKTWNLISQFGSTFLNGTISKVMKDAVNSTYDSPDAFNKKFLKKTKTGYKYEDEFITIHAEEI